MVTRDQEVGEKGTGWSKGTKSQFCRMSKYRDLMYSLMTIVNNNCIE